MIKLYRKEKPTFWYSKPAERITSITVELEGDDVVPIPVGAKSMRLRYARSADGGFGRREEDSAEIEFAVDEQPNPNYDKEMKVYEQAWERHLKDVSEWEAEMKATDEKEDQQNRALLAKLKERYERESC